MADDFERDANGMVMAWPVLGWTTAPVAGMTVLLRLSYARNPAELAGEPPAIQLQLTSRQALELAATLRRQGQRLLLPPDQKPD